MRKSEMEKEMDNLLNEMRKITYICKCGKRVMISQQDRALCSECGHWVYKNKALEFKYKMNEFLLNKQKIEKEKKEKAIEQLQELSLEELEEIIKERGRKNENI